MISCDQKWCASLSQSPIVMLRIQQMKSRPQGPTTSASPGDLIEMQVIGFHPPTYHHPLASTYRIRMRPSNLQFSRPSQVILMTLKLGPLMESVSKRPESVSPQGGKSPTSFGKIGYFMFGHQTFGNVPVSTARVTFFFNSLEFGKGLRNQIHLHQTYSWHWELKLLLPTDLILYVDIYNTFLFPLFSLVFWEFLSQANVEVHHRKFLKETLQREDIQGCLNPKILWIPSLKTHSLLFSPILNSFIWSLPNSAEVPTRKDLS